MVYELELSNANRLKLGRAFRLNKRVDMSIECAVEGQLGKVLVDDPGEPTAYCIRVGPFAYFAGDADSDGGQRLMRSLPAYNLLMPSPAPWLELARELFGESLQAFHRFTFSPAELSPEHLASLLSASRWRPRIIPLSAEVATGAAQQPDSFMDLSDFDSPADFIERGFGYSILEDGAMMGVAFTSLVCSQGIEVSIYVEEAHRRQGIATALSAALLLHSLELGLRPNWDAANATSIALAKRLGYVYTGSYEAYYHTRT
jgi:GNAT superfamily N-acetyltransferase